MGSAYPTIAADVIARYQRLQGKKVTFITGTDEHGEKIALAAEQRGMAPQQHCDDIVASYKALWHDVRELLRHRTTFYPVQGRYCMHACMHAEVSALHAQPPSPIHWQLDIAYDSFIRTTDAKHEDLVKQVRGVVPLLAASLNACAAVALG